MNQQIHKYELEGNKKKDTPPSVTYNKSIVNY